MKRVGFSYTDNHLINVIIQTTEKTDKIIVKDVIFAEANYYMLVLYEIIWVHVILKHLWVARSALNDTRVIVYITQNGICSNKNEKFLCGYLSIFVLWVNKYISYHVISKQQSQRSHAIWEPWDYDQGCMRKVSFNYLYCRRTVVVAWSLGSQNLPQFHNILSNIFVKIDVMTIVNNIITRITFLLFLRKLMYQAVALSCFKKLQ